MLEETQGDLYFERMASSLGDKEKLLPLIEGDTVLDVGAGGGELAETIRLTNRKVWALDGSHAATARIKEKFPRLNLLTGMAHEIAYLAPQAYFSTVVCSSIFHEVYSYGIPETGPYSIEALSLTLKGLYDALAPGGVLLLRDGVMPTAWDKEVKLHFRDDDGLRFWEAYHSQAPFASWAGVGPRCVKLYNINSEAKTAQANLASAMEFLYTYTWGWQSSQREMKELYGIFTEDKYRRFFEEHGFIVESSAQYLQPDYYHHLNQKVALLTPQGEPEPLPASNFILTARKL